MPVRKVARERTKCVDQANLILPWLDVPHGEHIGAKDAVAFGDFADLAIGTLIEPESVRCAADHTNALAVHRIVLGDFISHRLRQRGEEVRAIDAVAHLPPEIHGVRAVDRICNLLEGQVMNGRDGLGRGQRPAHIVREEIHPPTKEPIHRGQLLFLHHPAELRPGQVDRKRSNSSQPEGRQSANPAERNRQPHIKVRFVGQDNVERLQQGHGVVANAAEVVFHQDLAVNHETRWFSVRPLHALELQPCPCTARTVVGLRAVPGR